LLQVRDHGLEEARGLGAGHCSVVEGHRQRQLAMNRRRVNRPTPTIATEGGTTGTTRVSKGTCAATSQEGDLRDTASS